MQSVNMEKEKFWRGHLAMAAKSSGSVESYCRTNGLAIHNYYYWRKRLGRLSQSEPKNSNALSPFVQVEVESPRPSLPDPRWLAELIQALIINGGAR